MNTVDIINEYALSWGVYVEVVDDVRRLAYVIANKKFDLRLAVPGWTNSPGSACACLNYKRRIVLWQRNNLVSDWPWLLHEVSHIAAAKRAPLVVNELETMLGWELLSIRHLKLSERTWRRTILMGNEAKFLKFSVENTNLTGLFDKDVPSYTQKPLWQKIKKLPKTAL